MHCLDTKVTIIIGSYNHSLFISRAFQGIREQTYEDLSLIVFDDASADSSTSIIKEELKSLSIPTIFLENEDNLGLCRSLNEALRHTHAEYIMYQSADDWIDATAVESRVSSLEYAGDEVALCYGDARMVDQDGNDLGETFLERRLAGIRPPQGNIFSDIISTNFMLPLSTMIRRSAIESVGNFDESMLTEDHDMWMRIASKFQACYLDAHDCAYRQLKHSLTERAFTGHRKRSRKDHLRSLKKVLNIDPRVDKVIVESLQHYAITGYCDGIPPVDIISELEFVQRHMFNWHAAAYLLAARLRVPGQVLMHVRNVTRRGRA